MPAHHVSGTSVRKRSRLSKVGSSRLRRALYFPAITALRHNAAIKAFGQCLSQRGKAKMVVVAAAMRKLLHICYGVLKKRTALRRFPSPRYLTFDNTASNVGAAKWRSNVPHSIQSRSIS